MNAADFVIIVNEDDRAEPYVCCDCDISLTGGYMIFKKDDPAIKSIIETFNCRIININDVEEDEPHWEAFPLNLWFEILANKGE